MVDKGKFQLYPRYAPPLKAGLYRLTSQQVLKADNADQSLPPNKTPRVADLQTHVRIRSPQYDLSPDQVLSTYPPANHEGDFGSQLPQVVLKRRTLPWERLVAPGKDELPWLALVLIAEGEAELQSNVPVAQCVTAGVELDTPADVAVGNCLAIRSSAVKRLFPTQEEVGLLTHARAVDITDTELMMGDDDGFLAVVVCNRLPLPGTDATGASVPMKYLACLVNLCGQFAQLLPTEPAVTHTSHLPVVLQAETLTLAEADHDLMRTVQPGVAGSMKGVAATTTSRSYHVDTGVTTPYPGASTWGTSGHGKSVYDVMAEPFAVASTSGIISGAGELMVDPELRFPVLLHWSFTTTGNDTFKSLIQNIRSGLLGTAPEDAQRATGRPPFEVTETGHVGLDHRLRVGDQVRSWYRGPFVPNPTLDPADGRLALAHAADQLRAVVPDGREDLSLAAAFEIGRLLGLSRPSIVAAMMRWRQGGFQTAHQAGIWAGRGLIDGLGDLGLVLDRSIGGRLGALVATAVAERPSGVIGDPSPLVTAGRSMTDADPVDVLAQGLGIPQELFTGGATSLVGGLRGTAMPVAPGGVPTADAVRDGLGSVLDQSFTRAAVQALAPEINTGTLQIEASDLPSDLLAHLDSARIPDSAALRDRLGLGASASVLPKGADPIDVLMHAPGSGDEGEERR